MKKIAIIFFIIMLSCAFFTWRNASPKLIISRLANKGDISPKELKYRIYLLGVLPIGEAVFVIDNRVEEYQGIKVYHLNAIARPLSLYARVFKGYAILDSYIDINTLNPVLFKQRVEAPGKESPYKEIIYDQENNTVLVGGVARQMFPDTQDPLSAAFNIMHMEFDKVMALEMNINTNQKNYILEAKVTPKDLSLNKKIYKIVLIKAEIGRRDKNPYHRSNITIALLKEEENIPILIKVFASGFLINAKLTDIK